MSKKNQNDNAENRTIIFVKDKAEGHSFLHSICVCYVTENPAPKFKMKVKVNNGRIGIMVCAPRKVA